MFKRKPKLTPSFKAHHYVCNMYGVTFCDSHDIIATRDRYGALSCPGNNDVITWN